MYTRPAGIEVVQIPCKSVELDRREASKSGTNQRQQTAGDRGGETAREEEQTVYQS